MKKIFSWISDNSLFIATLFLLAFIPLYPKLPLLDIQNTWVYIRAEDFVVVLVLLIWAALFFSKKITLKTPLTLPILGFWLAGGLATIHGIILIFPDIANVFANVAFLSYLRHIEYVSLFFVAYAGMRDKRFLKIVISTIILTFIGVILYGLGQRYLGLPAFLTMNEEFAKGIPIQLSRLSRVPSTFAGHYDFAAYLVLIVPILASLMFGFKNWLIRIGLSVLVLFGFILMFMTVSRVSFVVLIITLLVALFFHKKKLVLFSVPVLLIAGFLFVTLQTNLFDRFGSTIREVNVLINAKTGQPIGHVNYVEPSYFSDKNISQQWVNTDRELTDALEGELEESKVSTPAAALPRLLFPEEAPLIRNVNVSNGEFLPQGTGYINLSLSPVDRKVYSFFYEEGDDSETGQINEVALIRGDFLIKRAAAYDLSFTTRFQGEWPNALEAFKRNILLGSGYGSISLAIDNNYLRMLGETGLLGTLSFISIFIALGIYIRKILPDVDSRLARSFVLGFSAGVIGLALNATLIDVFEASKIAFLLWLLVGVVVGLLSFYKTKSINIIKELLKAASSPLAIVVYIIFLTSVVYLPMLNNYFVGDDFTWLRWAADCTAGSSNMCPSVFERVLSYFTNSDGFFYRPGTKTYFLSMYSMVWFNQIVFHAVSIVLHTLVVILFFLLARKVLKSNGLAALGSILFIFMSGYSEIVFWISTTGYLFNVVFALTAILLFALWDEKRKIIYFIGSLLAIFLSTLFHELGVVVPLLIIIYKLTMDKSFNWRKIFRRFDYLTTFIPVGIYLILRFLSQSHWSGGDYSYSLANLPFNVVGNAAGYIFVTFLGPAGMPIYQTARETLRDNMLLGVVGVVVVGLALYAFYEFVFKKINGNDKRILIFGFSFFIISLLPFLALGNITQRYSYLASLGLVIILVYLIKKLYQYFMDYGREIAIGATAVIGSVFLLFHIIQVQQQHNDWMTAGNKVEKFFVSVDSVYHQRWGKGTDTQLYFIDPPIKHGNAWVFPVGLEDAVWLTFQDDDINVNIESDLEDVVRMTGVDRYKPVFVFNDDGSLTEVVRYINKNTGELEYELSN